MVVASQVVEKGVATGIRKALPKTLHFVELKPVPKNFRIKEKPRRSRRLENCKIINSTGTISIKLARQLRGKKKDEESPWAKNYRQDLELARKYSEEKAAMSLQQRNAGYVPREVVSPSAPTLYPRVLMIYE